MNQPPSKPQSLSPAAVILISILSFGVIAYLLNSAVNTPLVNQFDEAARQAEQAACESRKNYKNTEDCFK